MECAIESLKTEDLKNLGSESDRFALIARRAPNTRPDQNQRQSHHLSNASLARWIARLGPYITPEPEPYGGKPFGYRVRSMAA
jgi:hypothetical protein